MSSFEYLKLVFWFHVRPNVVGVIREGTHVQRYQHVVKSTHVAARNTTHFSREASDEYILHVEIRNLHGGSMQALGSFPRHYVTGTGYHRWIIPIVTLIVSRIHVGWTDEAWLISGFPIQLRLESKILCSFLCFCEA